MEMLAYVRQKVPYKPHDMTKVSNEHSLRQIYISFQSQS